MSQSRSSSATRAPLNARGAGLSGIVHNLVFLLALGFAGAIILGLVP
jgi:hypothetical protein